MTKIKYGIEITEKDNTPGFKDKFTRIEWYSNKEERDQAYNKFIIPPRLKYKEYDIVSYIEIKYKKVEEKE